MATTKGADKGRVRGDSPQAVGTAQAREAGPKFQWHYGRITRLGHSQVAGRGVSIVWEEGGATTQHGDISDEQWDVLKVAFLTTGRIAVLSDGEGESWMYDYRFLEAVR